jgi:cytoskeletal protein CcmA (bactofilin family)
MINKLGRFIATFAAILIISILMFVPVHAADPRAGQNVDVSAGEVVNDDLYLAGSEVTVDGTVNGDVVAVGSRVTINGIVNGSVTAAGSTVTINGTISNSIRAAAGTLIFNGKAGNDLVALAGQVTVSSLSKIGRDLLVNAGRVDVNGPVARNITCNAGSLSLGNSVGGNVKAEASEIKLGPSASVAGNLEYTSPNEASTAAGAAVKGQIKHVIPEKAPAPSNQNVATAVGAFVSTVIAFIFGLIIVLALIKYAAALLVAIVIILAARMPLESVIEALRARPWPCLGWGALIAVLVPIGGVILCITIVGIPLAAAGLAAYVIALFLGHIVTAIFLGKWMLRQPVQDGTPGHLIGAAALGLLVIYIVGLIPAVGVITDLAVLLFGFGSIIYYIKEKSAGKA